VIKSVPAGATVVGVPGHIAGHKPVTEVEVDLEHGRLPDPVLRALGEVLDRQGRLEERLHELERGHPHVAPAVPAREADIRQALREVIEPEIGINIIDLGMVREITLNGRGIEVRIVLPCPDCPQAGSIIEQVRRKVRSVTDGEAVEVVLADEPWSWNDVAPRFVGGDGI
jgi:serine O-acetyltransferase